MSDNFKKLTDLVDLKNKGPVDHLLTPAGEKHQSLRGFEAQYTDIVDYIVRITHRIWEEGDMGYIYDTYLHNCTVHTAHETSYGVEEVMSGSVVMLAGFPDRRIFADDVVWSGDDEQGFYTSHLITSTATNLGYSPWGPPTGKTVRYRVIADCLVRENRIVEEWLVRDFAAVVRQLGLDLWEVARRLARPPLPGVTGETDRLRGQLPPAPYEPRHDGAHVEDLVRRLFHEVWNRRRFNVITETHAPDVVMTVPNHLDVRGVNNIRAYLTGFVAMFPDAALQVEHVHWLGNGTVEDGYRVAVRWRFAGTHARYGWYGSPTNKRVDLLGISYLYIINDKVRKHHLVFDELAVVMQLVA